MLSDLDRVREALSAARRVLVITGAGISAESGIPTFRGPGGWWRNLDPARLATPAAFAADPVLVWEWYDHRRRGGGAGAPPGGLGGGAARAGAGVGGLVPPTGAEPPARGGSGSVLHVHGSLWTMRCVIDGGLIENREVPLRFFPPRCRCGGLLRPHITWFGEHIMRDAAAEVEAGLRAGFDVALVVGTEASFPYILEWALRAQGAGALLVEVNPVETALTDRADVHLRGAAGVVLPGVAG